MTAPTPRELLIPYLDAMLRENANVNLTAIRDRDAALVLHVDDSLALSALGLSPKHCLDLGSGNGFPGVALRVLFPTATVTLIERTKKKVLAIERALAAAQLSGITTLCLDAAQAPTLAPQLRNHFDLVTARALGEPRDVARLASPLQTPKGNLLLWLDADAEPPPALVPRFRLVKVQVYRLGAPAERTRKLALYEAHPTRLSRGC